MDKELILSNLGQHPWAGSLLILEETASTNTLLKSLGQQGAPQGTVVIADRQGAGRGRLGRTFLSPGGTGIYLSALIRPNAAPTELMHLTCAVGTAMCDALEAATGVRTQIKWINDLVVGKRKLGGILTELSLNPKTGLVDHAVLGIGINCNQQTEDFDGSIRDMATSLSIAAGKPILREQVAAEMIRALHTMSLSLLPEKQRILDRYRQLCVTLGQQVQVIRSDRVRRGTALDIDPDGALIVAYDSGETEAVSSGEVSVRGMYGYV